MITSYKQKANIAGGICVGSLVGLVILGRVLAVSWPCPGRDRALE
jgi:hypothetical protein